MDATKADLKKADLQGMSDYLASVADLPLLGEVFSCVPKGPHSYASVMKSLDDAGLDPDEVTSIDARRAFLRAKKTLEDKRIIRKLEETESFLKFQLTKEDHDRTGLFQYTYECVLTLDKRSGSVTGDDADLVQKADRAILEAMGTRTTGDISAIVRRIIAKNVGRLFTVPGPGGYYFVPDANREIPAKLEKFIRSLGGRVGRLPIPAGQGTGERTVADSVMASFEQLVSEYEQAIADLPEDATSRMFSNQTKKIEQARFKLDSFAGFLGDRREDIHKEFDRIGGLLADRIVGKVVARENAPEETLAPLDEEVVGQYAQAVLDDNVDHPAEGALPQLSH